MSKVGSFKQPGVLPPVLDLEATGGLGPAALRTWVSTWLTTVEDLDAFWGSIWDRFEVGPRADVLLATRSMPGASWFPGTTPAPGTPKF